MENNELTLQDIFNINEIQEIQDAFANATGVASIITDTDGKPITRPSNFCRLCLNIIRKTEKGLANCIYSDSVLGTVNLDGPIIQPCLSGGLLDGGTSICVGKKHIANWLIGQVVNSSCNEEQMIAYAREIGADETEFKKALKEVPRMSKEQFEKVCKALFIFARKLSDLAIKNVQQDSYIIERNNVEKDLIESERRYRFLYNHTPVMMHSIDNNGYIVSVSDYWLFKMGYTREEVIGKQSTDFLTEASKCYAREVVLPEYRTKGYCHNIEYQFVKKNGEIIETALSAISEQDSGGNIIRSLAVLIDVTEKKKAEIELRKSENKYRTLFLSTNEGFAFHKILYDNYGVSEDYMILEVNPAFETITGIKKEKAIGEKASKLYNTDQAPYLELYTRVAETGKSEYIETYFPPMGKHFNISVYSPEKGFFATVFSDITQSKIAEEKIKKINQELEQRVLERTRDLTVINKELEAFSYSVSHDLRAPLRSIDGFSQALLEDYGTLLDDTGKDYLHRVRKASQYMGQLIDDLLKLSRVSRSEIQFEKVNISRLISKIINGIVQQEPERKKEISITPDIIARADMRLLNIALQNLLENAWKFTSKKAFTKIEFDVINDKGKNIYSIRDNGAGFDMIYSKKLFGPFQRLHSGDEFPGTGIGLATVQRIIHRHGGYIWVESTLGEGTTFYFTLE